MRTKITPAMARSQNFLALEPPRVILFHLLSSLNLWENCLAPFFFHSGDPGPASGQAKAAPFSHK